MGVGGGEEEEEEEEEEGREEGGWSGVHWVGGGDIGRCSSRYCRGRLGVRIVGDDGYKGENDLPE